MLTGDYCMVLSADDLLTRGAFARATATHGGAPGRRPGLRPDITFRDTPPPDDAALHPPASSPRDLPRVPERVVPSRPHAAFRRRQRSCAPRFTAESATTCRSCRTAATPKSGCGWPPTRWWASWMPTQAFRRLHSANMSLGYSPLRRLVEQKRAFDIHFEHQAPLSPEIVTLQDVVHRTIAESAFWSAARAFERGDVVDRATSSSRLRRRHPRESSRGARGDDSNGNGGLDRAAWRCARTAGGPRRAASRCRVARPEHRDERMGRNRRDQARRACGSSSS